MNEKCRFWIFGAIAALNSSLFYFWVAARAKKIPGLRLAVLG
ncbi:hypothetical protein D082_04490 [Synechocystis sp. PCC 6714]|nr:hypothetical protein D082_04490 [Synechocystis sp. PCC 6714]